MQPAGISWAAHCLFGDSPIRNRPDEIAAHPDEDLYPALRHCLDRMHYVVSMRARRRKPEHPFQLIQQLRLRLLVDTDRSIALYIRVAAHRADACARPAEIPAQQQQIDKMLDVRRAVSVLGNTHPIADDDCACPRVNRRNALQLLPFQSAGVQRMSSHAVRRISSANASKP